MALAPPRVQLEAISKRYPGVQALDRVTLSILPGCVHALVGENGAGKSTLMKILAGATQLDSGQIRLDGRPLDFKSVRDAQANGIAVVYQELSLAGDLTVGENIFLGRWPRSLPGLVSFQRLAVQAQKILDSLGVSVPVSAPVSELSIAQQQMVEIARAFTAEVRVLLLDEPSAVLTPAEIKSMFDLVRGLTRRGCSVIYVTHRLEEVFSLADHVTVLRDGLHISTRPIAEVHRDNLIRDMVGRPILEEFPRRTHTPGDVVLRVRQLSAPRRMEDITFEIRGGEVFALTGLVGSGRSSVGKAVFGCVPRTSGNVTVDTTTGPFHSPGQAKRAGVAFLPEDRKAEGLLLERSLQENLSLAHLHEIARRGFLRAHAERRLAEEKIAQFGIVASHPLIEVSTLSGGNQQKTLIARWLRTHYRVIILDEPTRGVDVGARTELYVIINRMAAAGAAVLLITSDLLEAIGLADRIGVMSKGRLIGVLDNAGGLVKQEGIMELAVT